jgi:hypothetical protein
MIYLLTLLDEEYDIEDLLVSARIRNVYSGLLRKGLISDNNTLLLPGKALLEFIKTVDYSPLVKKKSSNAIFDLWWKSYPGTDTFKYKNKTFAGSRSLRVNKDKCKDKFQAIVNEGEYTGQMLIDAMLFDVVQKKEISLKKRENKLTYMQNSLTYLNQRSFEPFIELIESGVESEKSTRGREIDV